MRGIGVLALAVCGLWLAGCAASPGSAGANDPFEPMNRGMFTLDEKFNKYVVLPVASVYLYNLPAPIRKGLHNVVSNADLPVTFANDVLQGEFDKGAETLKRFTLNSTAGLGGLMDVAVTIGLPQHRSDFGQTLAKYGVGPGPFLVLPIIGPEPPRDLVGDAFDIAIDPLTWLPPSWPLGARIGTAIGLHIANPFEAHARNIFLRQQLEKDSLDPYATMRSTYRQVRAQEIAGGKPTDDESLEAEPAGK